MKGYWLLFSTQPRSILPLNIEGYAAKEKDVHFTAFKFIVTEAVLLNWNLLSFFTVLFVPVSSVFKNIETKDGLIIETKVQGEKISANNQTVGGRETEAKKQH